jgi:hypothetical protein
MRASFAGRVEAGFDFGDSGLLGDGRGGGGGVAGEHQDAQARRAAVRRWLGCVGAECVAGVEVARREPGREPSRGASHRARAGNPLGQRNENL